MFKIAFQTHEKYFGRFVYVLVQINNIALLGMDKAGNRTYDALLVWAVYENRNFQV